jgi:tetratricopeptide (TPR) repeat protein
MVEQAVALNPNLAIAWYSRGWVSLMCCEDERAIESFDRMIRLSPLDPLRVPAWIGCSFALFGLGRYEDGFVSAKKAIQFFSDACWSHYRGARRGRPIVKSTAGVSRLSCTKIASSALPRTARPDNCRPKGSWVAGLGFTRGLVSTSPSHDGI